MKLTIRQTIALDYLEDDVTNEVGYGGGAGGGKSILGCYWQIKNRLKFPNTRGLIGRASLKTLRETTLQSFLYVTKEQGLVNGTHFRYNAQSNQIHFFNGSIIFLKDLFLYPSDPNFDELGSLEITDAFIDESAQIAKKAFDIVQSRMRYNLDGFCHICGDNNKEIIINQDSNNKPIEWICKNSHQTKGLIPKILWTSNPSKNWNYSEFYQPHKKNELPPFRKFVQSLVTDNPFISQHYINNLNKLPQIDKERLLFGNWEYDDDPARLMEYDKIVDVFTNSFVQEGKKCITADVARFGSDKAVIMVWSGFRVVKIKTFDKSAITELETTIKQLCVQYSVPLSNVVVDEDGVGGGLVDMLQCKGFINNSKALEENDSVVQYQNLKSQCYFHLSYKINASEVFISETEYKELIIQELEQVKRHNIDKDGKLAIIPKEKVKELLGRSPDFADALMMRMFFELEPKQVETFFF